MENAKLINAQHAESQLNEKDAIEKSSSSSSKGKGLEEAKAYFQSKNARYDRIPKGQDGLHKIAFWLRSVRSQSGN